MSTPLPEEPRRRLVAAHKLLEDPELLDDGGLWPRSCTWLIRLALEHALDDYWQRTRPDVAKASRRAQLLVVTRLVDNDLGLRATTLWHELSRVAHHHAYELAPTAEELRRWHRGVYGVATDLATSDAPSSTGTPTEERG